MSNQTITLIVLASVLSIAALIIGIACMVRSDKRLRKLGIILQYHFRLIDDIYLILGKKPPEKPAL